MSDSDKIRVGDIFYESWGYDQTQNDFAQVMRISPSGKTVICRMMGKEIVEDGWKVKPTEVYGVEFRLKIDVWYDREDGRYRGTYLRGSYPFVQGSYSERDAHGIPTGKMTEWKSDFRGPVSFSHYEGKPVYETPAGFGH